MSRDNYPGKIDYRIEEEPGGGIRTERGGPGNFRSTPQAIGYYLGIGLILLGSVTCILLFAVLAIVAGKVLGF